jgi:precorrin-6y C5,15-methyltransferase (decarboxylating) CbiE subunit
MAMKIAIVGCGPGSPDYLTRSAVRAAQRAEVLVGSQRLLDLFSDADAERLPVGADINLALDLIAAHYENKSVAVLVSGDPGLFSLTKRVIEHFGRDSCEIIAGVSSVQVAFARLGLDWADARIISAHKENPDSALLESLKHEDKVAVLAGRREAVDWVADLAGMLGKDRRIFVCENLTLDDEKVREVYAERLSQLEVGSRTVVLIINSALLK